ncbi:hypothetical protein ACEWY4_020604 [Coilia grayii]|uniref:Uncharacterized protein n=1 Tax=Coilia grayii TaxID=363190 RepID=A0ABD1J817_9TELE
MASKLIGCKVSSISNIFKTTFYWFVDNNTEPVVTLEGWLLTSFQRVGGVHVSLQVASEGVVRQDSSTIRVTEAFRSMLVAFSPNLEDHNPAIPEWREDLARVVTATISQMSEVLVHALQKNWVQFLLRPEVKITAQLTHLGLASQVGSGHLPGISALLLFMCVAAVGAVTFLMGVPWLQVQAEEPQQKGADVMDAGRQSISSSNVPTQSSSPRISFNHASPRRVLPPPTLLKTAHVVCCLCCLQGPSDLHVERHITISPTALTSDGLEVNLTPLSPTP